MSRSNDEQINNPCTTWMEWGGATGNFKSYDKEKKEKVEIPFGVTFLLLEQLACVKGWHDASESGIYSNEVKDTAKQPMTVKAFKGGPIASGFYKEIRDKVVAAGGHFTANLYVAMKIDDEMKIASIQFKGAALNSWIDFAKKNKAVLFKKAITVDSVMVGKKGSVTFKTPVFALKEVSEATDQTAKGLDVELQDYLKKYFAKNTTEQVERVETASLPDFSSEHKPGKIEPNKKQEPEITFVPLPEMDQLPF